MLSQLIGEFEALCLKLAISVSRGDEHDVARIDGQLAPLMRSIFAHEGADRMEIARQLSFFAGLAVSNCEDDASVRRYTGMMIALTNRYLDRSAYPLPVTSREAAKRQAETSAPTDGYDLSVPEMILNSIPERVAVIGRDYRYIYVNEPNASFHAMRPSQFIGVHISERIGSERFFGRAKAKLDQCFAGARLAYHYEIGDLTGHQYDVQCRMTPLVGPDDKIVAAILVLSMHLVSERVD